MIGLGLRLGMGRGGAGGGGLGAPVITGQAYDEPTNEITANVDQAGTAFWLFNQVATPLSAAFIIANAVGSAAVTTGINYLTADDTGLPSGTNYLHFTVRNATSQATDPGVVVAFTMPVLSFLEDWSSYAAGDDFADLDPAYSRTDTAALTSIVTNASGPAGLACQISSGAHKSLFRDDITAALALRTTSQRVQVRTKWKLLSTANARGGFGHRVATDSNTGIIIQRFGPTAHAAYIQVAGNPSTGTNATGIASGLSDNAILWTLMEIDGLNIKGKAWLDGAGEPGSWTTRTEATAIAVASMGPCGRAGSPSHEILGYRVAIDADAGTF